MNLQFRNLPLSRRGFSLTELLITIAVIGVISAIAMSQISKMNDAGSEAAARRNAQNIASVSSSANAAGAYHVIPESMGGGVEMSIEVLTLGVKSTVYDMNFKISLGKEHIKNAAKYLTIEPLGTDYALHYNAD